MWDKEAIPLATMRGQPSALTQVRRHPEDKRKKFKWQNIRVDVADERIGNRKGTATRASPQKV